MLKCPRCGTRVKGPDLLSGVCSACQYRLSESISDLDNHHDGDQTFVSDDDGSASSPEGSSIDEAYREQIKASSSQNPFGDQLGSSFDLKLTPAAAADGLHDLDTADSVVDDAGSSASADAEQLKTFVSDVWDADSSESGARTGDSGQTAAGRDDGGESSSDDAEAALRTQVSDVDPDADDPEAAQQTFVSDELPPGGVEATLRTITGDADFAAADADDDGGADRTYVEDAPVHAADDNSRTIVVDEADADGGAADQTFVSDDVPEVLVKTLQSYFGEEDPAARPGQTLKGKELERVKSPKSTLVIKTRLLKDMQPSIKSTGSTLDPEYELLEILGEGGMGVVYDARQTSIDRQVALKMIKGNAARNEKQQAKFLAEAVVTGDLDHPNIVPIYDVGRNETGALFYSMKKVQGTPWDKVIGQKTLSENLDILLRVADAVAFAHARGVVHRDLKPENTMLGEYGEVLVMDWGLAQPSKRFRKSASISDTSSMGGTPAYMAPEMATGPLDKISHLSDVYLLGAILFEVLTGRPPHSGKNAMKCLMAAARNEIVPTDKSGELLDIARKAMATEPDDRYSCVQAFQAAIREYQSHSESILLSTRAEDDLEAAKQSDEYPTYAKALFGFEEAYELWPGNVRARSGIAQAQLAYADSARRKGDFDLGLSLLNPQYPAHEQLIAQLQEVKRERESRQQRLAALRRMAFGLAGAVFVTVTVAFFWISYEADKARRAERIAIDEKQAADVARGQAEVSEASAVASRDLAEARQREAETARMQEAAAREEAVAARDLAEEKRKEAEDARRLEEIAKRKEEYEAYIAQIGLAAAKIDENAFESARQILEGCKPELRNWEWGRLMHLCSQSTTTIDARSPLDSLALAPSGQQCATGGWDGVARVWDLKTGKPLHEFQHGGLYVHSVAFSPDGRWLATGSDDPAGFVQLWDLTSGERLAVLSGHTDAVLSVAFNRDGKQLLTSSYDKTARLWNVADRSEIRVFRGHTWWVWQAVFSPNDRQIVTVGQDGIAIVWDTATGERSPAFTGHRGPVYCAAFVGDGSRVVTGGYDRRLLEWSPAQLAPHQFRNLERGADVTQTPRYRELGGHATSIRCVAVSSDGALLLSGSQDNTLRLWNLATGQILQTFRGHDSWIRGVAFGQDGRLLISGSQDSTIRTWSLAGYEELRSFQGRALEGHADAVLAATFSPDQTQIVTASRDRTARTWDAVTGEVRQTFAEGHAFLASSAQFFDDGRKLVTAAVDNTARIWDVASGTERQRLDRSGRAAALAVSPDGRWIATGGDAKQVQLWHAETGELASTLVDHQSEVTAVTFTPDGQRVISGDARGRCRVWNVETAQLVGKFDAHTGRITGLACTPDGARLLMSSNDRTVSQWDLAKETELTQEILKHPDSVLTFALSPDGNRVVTSCADRKVRIWNRRDVQVTAELGPFSDLVYSVAISDDGERLLTAHTEERVVRQWELATGQELRVPRSDKELGPALDLKRTGGLVWATSYAPGDDVLTVGGSDARLWDMKTGRERITFSPHATVASASFSPDGHWIVTGSWDNSAKIWNAETGSAALKLTGQHRGFVNSAVFSPDGKTVLTSSDDGTAKLWRITLPGMADSTPVAEVIMTFEGHADRVRFAAFSPDGQTIVTTSDDKTARLWQAATGAAIRQFEGHAWAVLTADFSPDGQRLVTGSEDNFAKIWDIASGECLLTLTGHTAPVSSVAFAPDQARVLTGSRDQSAKLWDAQTGKEILSLTRHTDDVTSVRFSPDGRQILTASRDGTAVLWLTMKW